MTVGDHLPQNKITKQWYYELSFKSSLFLTTGTKYFELGAFLKIGEKISMPVTYTDGGFWSESWIVHMVY